MAPFKKATINNGEDFLQAYISTVILKDIPSKNNPL